MASKYKTVQYGSSGDEVKDLQTKLNSYGYNLTVDGNFGEQTQNAVLDYQKKYNLTQDGIVGDQTWASLTGGTSAPQSEFTTTAIDARRPGDYQSQYDEQIRSLYDKITNQQPFQFDLNASALYNQYRDQYTTLGRQAMVDTMGQAAGLTGGYGSSYSQNVGQQAYNAYLQRLNDVIPEIYAQERSNYDADRQWLMQQLSLAQGLDDSAYGRWSDDFSRWLQERAMAQEQENWQADMDFAREQWEYQKGLAGGSGGSGSYGIYSSGGSDNSGADEENEDPHALGQTMLTNGMTIDDVQGWALELVNTGQVMPIGSTQMDNWAKSHGIYGDALQYFRAYVNYYYQQAGIDPDKTATSRSGGASPVPRTVNYLN